MVCVPAFFFLLYRAIAPYEPAMAEHRLAGSMFYPGIAGFALGLAHTAMDPDLIGNGFGALAFLVLYPIVETYVVIVIFNRNLFYKQSATPVFFAMGGATLGFGLAFWDVFQALGVPARGLGDLGFLAAMVGLASAMVLFHASKGLMLGTYFAEGSRMRGILAVVALEVPFGALSLAVRFPGVDVPSIVALMLVYGVLFYYLTWHVFFIRRMPDVLRTALDKERKRARRIGIARARK